jgi:hypothetical protein
MRDVCFRDMLRNKKIVDLAEQVRESAKLRRREEYSTKSICARGVRKLITDCGEPQTPTKKI